MDNIRQSMPLLILFVLLAIILLFCCSRRPQIFFAFLMSTANYSNLIQVHSNSNTLGFCFATVKMKYGDTEFHAISRTESKKLYDSIGWFEDYQGFYKTIPRKKVLQAILNKYPTKGIAEIGSGTGSLAYTCLVSSSMQSSCPYFCIEHSSTMRELSVKKLSAVPNPQRVVHIPTDGRLELTTFSTDFQNFANLDVFCSMYLLNIMSTGDITTIINQAHSLLETGGLLVTAELSYPEKKKWSVSHIIIAIWIWISRRYPLLLGGSRPVDIASFLREEEWQILSNEICTSFGIPTQVLVAKKR